MTRRGLLLAIWKNRVRGVPTNEVPTVSSSMGEANRDSSETFSPERCTAITAESGHWSLLHGYPDCVVSRSSGYANAPRIPNPACSSCWVQVPQERSPQMLQHARDAVNRHSVRGKPINIVWRCVCSCDLRWNNAMVCFNETMQLSCGSDQSCEVD